MSEDLKACIGESFSSVKQLITRTGLIGRVNLSGGWAGNGMRVYDFWNVSNFVTGLASPYSGSRHVWGSGVLDKSEADGDLYKAFTPVCGYLSLMYGLARGSSIYTARQGRVSVHPISRIHPRYAQGAGGPIVTWHRRVTDAFWIRAREPFYSVYPFQPTGVNRPQENTQAERAIVRSVEGFSDVYVSAADDAQLGLFISTWPLVVPRSDVLLHQTAYDAYYPEFTPSTTEASGDQVPPTDQEPNEQASASG